MEDVVKAIEQLAEKDVIDCLLVMVPIVVSIVAIDFYCYGKKAEQNSLI